MLELFPTELKEIILIKLKVKDLVSCCGVSREWRSQANSDLLWRHHCNRHFFSFAVMEKYKDVLFHKYSYNGADTGLEPLCLWRMVYSVNQVVMKSWQNGEWMRYIVKKVPQPFCLDCNEEHMASGDEDGSIKIWSVQLLKLIGEKNRFGFISKQCLLKGTPVISIQISDKYVLTLQKQLLQIYQLTEVDLLLVGACSYELGENSMDLTNQAKLLGLETPVIQKEKDGGLYFVSGSFVHDFNRGKFDHWYKECIRNYDVYPVTRLKFLAENTLCFTSVGGSKTVDIWAIEGNIFRQAKACLSGFSKVRSIVKNWGEVFIISGEHRTVVTRYCWSGNEAKEVISVSGYKKIVFGEDYILAIPHPSDMKMAMLWVWDRKYNLVRTRMLTSVIVCAVATTLVVYTENSLVTVWDPRKDVVLKTFSVGTSIGFMRHAHSTIIVIFVNASLDVWDFLKGKRLSRLISRLEWSGDFRELLWLNSSAVIAGGVCNNIQYLRNTIYDFS